jgi:solute carrier family 35 (adenosine 3'-phospho 5'-phosphosulfate transporter), member B3
MQYINYPAKTLIKSSRVVFTMLFGVLIHSKVYKLSDYIIVVLMVIGLGSFLHADSQSSAVFELRGVLYSISLLCIAVAAAANGDLQKGLVWSLHDGTYDEYLQMTNNGDHDGLVTIPSYSALTKVSIMVLFSSMGFFGSSCSAAITKNFGALTMSITSTARKATTLFLSFGLFRDNVCTFEHIFGMLVFSSSLMVPLVSPPASTVSIETKSSSTLVHVV